MPIVNILFWSTLILAALAFWRIHVYMVEAEYEAIRQYEQLAQHKQTHYRSVRVTRSSNSTYSSRSQIDRKEHFNLRPVRVEAPPRTNVRAARNCNSTSSNKQRRYHNTVA